MRTNINKRRSMTHFVVDFNNNNNARLSVRTEHLINVIKTKQERKKNLLFNAN